MKVHAKLVVALGFLLATLFSPRPAAAQRSSVQSVTCESKNGKRNYCGSYTRDQVTFQRQISGSSCVERQSWGVDRQGLWVDSGCRAVLAVRVVVTPLPGPGWIRIPAPAIPGRPRAVGMAAGGTAAAPASTKVTASAAIFLHAPRRKPRLARRLRRQNFIHSRFRQRLCRRLR